MKTLITSSIFLLLAWAGLDLVSIWVLLISILISQSFVLKSRLTLIVTSVIATITAYYIFLFDGSNLIHNQIYLASAIGLGFIYQGIEKGSISIRISKTKKKEIRIPSKIQIVDGPIPILICFIVFLTCLWIAWIPVEGIFYSTSNFVSEKTFLTLGVLIFSIYGNYFTEESFGDFVESIISKEPNYENLLPIFEGVNFIKLITSIILVVSIALNSKNYINSFGDSFYKATTLLETRSINPISELVRVVNDVFINAFF